MRNPRAEIERILTEADRDRMAGMIRVGLAVDDIRAKTRELRGCFSDETVAAISAGRVKPLLKNAWHLARCPSCLAEILDLRAVVSSTSQGEVPEVSAGDSYAFLIRNWRKFLIGTAA